MSEDLVVDDRESVAVVLVSDDLGGAGNALLLRDLVDDHRLDAPQGVPIAADAVA